MRKRAVPLVCSALVCAFAAYARGPETPGCGTHFDKAREELFLHQQSLRSRVLGGTELKPGTRAAAARLDAHRRALLESARASNRDMGQIAVVDSSGGVIARRNTWNLQGRTVRFVPSTADAVRYRTESAAGPEIRGKEGPVLAGLGDDDSRPVAIPFAFPFFGATYRSVFVNSDGNLTFGQADAGSTDRSLGRMTAGPARISPMFTDLDPTQSAHGVRVSSTASALIITWDAVPLYSQFGGGAAQTFEVRLSAGGAIEFAYAATTSVREAVVGIAPGRLQGTTSVVSFQSGAAGEFSAAVVERFASSESVDIATVAHKFYATHDDAYDYLVIYNTASVSAASTAVAYEVTVRNNASGHGDAPIDTGQDFGSGRRLRAVLNMGPLDPNYSGPNGPLGPDEWLPIRGSTHDTPVTVLAHEAGHLFLAFASVRDPNDPEARPMLNPRNGVHWAFTFNSEASVLEGNRIEDTGSSSPRFRTSGSVEAYSPLDQYLMGFRAPSEVADSFVVTDATVSPSALPRSGVTFDGERRNVSVDEIIAVEGRRIPDHTVAQRHFRFAFILVVPEGQEPSAQQLAQVESYRAAFEEYYTGAASFRATADATLKRAVQFSGAPAMGVIAGTLALANVSVEAPPESPLVFNVETRNGALAAPGSVTIAAGSRSAVLSLTGVREGVEELWLRPADSRYEAVTARVQVRQTGASLALEVVSGDRQTVTGGALPLPITLRVTDANRLSYANVRVRAQTLGGGTLDRTLVTADENGLVQFRWAPAGPGELIATVDGSAAQVRVRALAAPVPAAVANSASWVQAISPGSLASLFGTNLTGGVAEQAQSVPLPLSLAGIEVLVDGVAAGLYYASDTQINFVVPAEAQTGQVRVTVSNGGYVSAPVIVQSSAARPGIFFAGRSDGHLIIYATGLGALRSGSRGLLETVLTPEVRMDGTALAVSYSGEAPGFPGLYQVNAVVPSGAPPESQTVELVVGGIVSNRVRTTP